MFGAERAHFVPQAVKTCGAFAANACLLERFRAKWTPVRVKKTRPNKNLDGFRVSKKSENSPGESAQLRPGAQP
jgi:hypothetical protein